jgi:hypothetical protein
MFLPGAEFYSATIFGGREGEPATLACVAGCVAAIGSDCDRAMRPVRRQGQADFPSSCRDRLRDLAGYRRDPAGTSTAGAGSNTNNDRASGDDASRASGATRLARQPVREDYANWFLDRRPGPVDCCDDRGAHDADARRRRTRRG